MWPLRRNVQYNKRYFFKDILFFVFLCHLLLLGILFICDKGKFHQEKFVINANDLQSTVVFMPLQKKVAQQKTLSKGSVKDSGSRHVMSYDVYEKKMMQVDHQKLEQQKKNQIKSIDQKIPEKIKVQEIKIEQKLVSKKVVVELVKQPAKTIKVDVSKKVPSIVKKSEVKKPVSKNAAVKSKIESKKKIKSKISVDDKKISKNLVQVNAAKEKEQSKEIDELKVEPLVSSVESRQVDSIVQKVIQQEIINNDESIDKFLEEKVDLVAVDLENISFVGSVDLEMILIKEQIYTQIAQYYKPPVGISKKAVCQFSIGVGMDGKAGRIIVKKSSGSIANDICARAALLKIIFPKEVIGKEIIIELGQS